MSGQPQLFRIDPENKQAEAIEEVDFARLGFQERRDIQEWVAANPSILGEDLLIISKEFSGFDRTAERLDLLALDPEGKVVIIELKRDDTGTDVHWQAIKYASYLQHTKEDAIIRMLADYQKVSEPEARYQIVQHLQADDLSALNHAQRIIIASHRFAPEVTSAALWLNGNVPGHSLITCVQLIPYHDPATNTHYLQGSTIIPLPGVEDYVVSVGEGTRINLGGSNSSFAVKLNQAFARNKDDEVTHFLRNMGKLTVTGLPEAIRPNKTSRWAGDGSGFRYYHFWYSRPPWGNWRLSYRVNLYQETEPGYWRAGFELRGYPGDAQRDFTGIEFPVECLECRIDSAGITATVGTGQLDEEFKGKIAGVVRKFVEEITPIVDDLGNEDDGSVV